MIAESQADEGARMARQLKIVKLIEPEICLECRFAQMADVEASDGSINRMIYCKRLDCDNWDTTQTEPAKSVQIDEDLAA